MVQAAELAPPKVSRSDTYDGPGEEAECDVQAMVEDLAACASWARGRCISAAACVLLCASGVSSEYMCGVLVQRCSSLLMNSAERRFVPRLANERVVLLAVKKTLGQAGSTPLNLLRASTCTGCVELGPTQRAQRFVKAAPGLLHVDLSVEQELYLDRLACEKNARHWSGQRARSTHISPRTREAYQ